MSRRGTVAADWQRLTGQRGHVDVDRTVEQPGVRRDPFALLDEQHVPGDELARRHGQFAAVTHHPRLLREVGPQRLDRADRLAFLSEGEQRVQRDHGEDRPAEGGRPRGEGQEPGRPQQQSQRVTHLPDQLTPPRLRAAARQLVGADDVEAAGDLPARQPAAVRAQVTKQAAGGLGRVDGARHAVRHGGHRRHAGHQLLAHATQSTPPRPGSGRAEGPIAALRRPDGRCC